MADDQEPVIPEELWMIWCPKLKSWGKYHENTLVFFSVSDAYEFMNQQAIPVLHCSEYGFYPVKVK